jgi:phosphopantetheinyl transferase (holo-ACP synthase)
MQIGVDVFEIVRPARLVEKSATFTRRTFSPKELGAAAQMTGQFIVAFVMLPSAQFEAC